MVKVLNSVGRIFLITSIYRIYTVFFFRLLVLLSEGLYIQGYAGVCVKPYLENGASTLFEILHKVIY